jgi:hypothetical protein
MDEIFCSAQISQLHVTSGMIETQGFPKARLALKFIILAKHPLFPVC